MMEDGRLARPAGQGRPASIAWALRLGFSLRKVKFPARNSFDSVLREKP